MKEDNLYINAVRNLDMINIKHPGFDYRLVIHYGKKDKLGNYDYINIDPNSKSPDRFGYMKYDLFATNKIYHVLLNDTDIFKSAKYSNNVYYISDKKIRQLEILPQPSRIWLYPLHGTDPDPMIYILGSDGKNIIDQGTQYGQKYGYKVLA